MTRQASPESLDSYMLDDRSLSEWHEWLTTDHQTNEPTGHLEAPCSRYGRTASECAYWALAGEIAFRHASGVMDEPEHALDWLLGVVVNDQADLASTVLEYWDVIPRALRQQLGGKEHVRGLR